jgi:DNA helicase-2/ATP-dependent DNA helicase PcrA
VLRATRPPGPEPLTRSFSEPYIEAAFIVERVRELHDSGLPYEEMAILFRTNARSADYEEALSEAEIPSQGAALLAREAAKQLLKAMRGRPLGDVRRVASDQGMLETIPDRLGEREVTRQNDLARLVKLAEEFEGTIDEFVAYLQERFGTHAGRGVHLLTYHRAKGLEFEAVFLPRLEEKELPSKLSKTPAALEEERRLLYVGLTRAKRHLSVTWAGKPSRFLAELDLRAPVPKALEPDDPLYETLKEWRLKTAKAEEKPAYVIFHNSTLAEIVRRAPRTKEELAAVPGVGPAKLERYGDAVLAALER